MCPPNKRRNPIRQLMLIYHRCAGCIFIPCICFRLFRFCRIFWDDGASHGWMLSRMNRSENSSCFCVNTLTQNLAHKKWDDEIVIQIHFFCRSLCTGESELTIHTHTTTMKNRHYRYKNIMHIEKVNCPTKHAIMHSRLSIVPSIFQSNRADFCQFFLLFLIHFLGFISLPSNLIMNRSHFCVNL